VSAAPHLFWITSRAAGIAALVLSSLAVTVGLLMATRWVRGRGIELRALHETLSLAALVAIALHGVSLLFDGWLHPGVAGIAVPFASAYRALWTGIGVIGGYGLAVLGLTYYARERIGQVRWRTIHRFTSLFWLLGVVHTIGAGTDAKQAWFLLAMAVPVITAAIPVAARAAASIGTVLDLPRDASPMRQSD
jgi:methionine sulfoxide reductase heme-binding subunit